MAEKNPNKEVLEKIGDKLECTICLTEYTDPKLLPCFHAFCKECLEPLVIQDHNGLSLKCPICRQTTELPPKGVTGLQSNFHVDHLFEIRDALKKVRLTVTGSRTTKCEKCNDDEAIAFCRDCGQFICDGCTKVHRKWKEFETHEVISPDLVEEESKQMVCLKKKVAYCSRHPGRDLRIYCETCSELICTDCTIGLHPRPEHHFNLVTDIFAEYKEELEEGLEPMKEQLVIINGALDSFDSRKKEIKGKKKVVEADIHEQINQIQQVMEQRRGELITKLDSLVNEKQKNLAAQMNEVEQVRVQLSSCVDYAEGSLKTGTPAQVVAMKDSILERVEQITADFESVALDPEGKRNFKVTEISKLRKYELHEGISELVDIIEDSESEEEEEEEEEKGSSQSEDNFSDDDDEDEDHHDSGGDEDDERLQYLFFNEPPVALLKMKRLW